MEHLYRHLLVVSVPLPFSGLSHQVSCFHCTGVTRHLRADGKIAYENGDRTMTPAVNSQCGCGYRHYWDGGEYDNLPEK